MSDKESIELFDTLKCDTVAVKASTTANGNKSFEYRGLRHIITPDGTVKHMIRYAYGGASWETSPVLRCVDVPGHDATVHENASHGMREPSLTKPKGTGQRAEGNNCMDGLEKPRFRATMCYGYGRRKRPDVTASTTFEAILRGERNSTTRFDRWRGSEKWAEANPGDLVEFFSGARMTGESCIVRVVEVRRISLATCSEEELEAWSRAEGWLPEEGRKLGRAGGSAYWVIYELVSPALCPPPKSEEDTQFTLGL